MSEETKEQIVVLGAGTWGIVLAQLARANRFPVRAWDYDPRVIETLSSKRKHPMLPDFEIDESIELTSDLAKAMEGAKVAVVAVPASAVRETFETLKEQELDVGVEAWIICSKGIEQDTLLTLDSVIVEVLGSEVRDNIGVLSGPSHAEEVSRDLPTTVTACSTNAELSSRISTIFFGPNFRIYTHDDVLGVELGAALKNVIAIAAGISDGLGFGDNSRAALVTRGLAEIVRLGVAMGARRETFMGLSGLGDLVVTTGSAHSRNHRFGECLAAGLTCEEALSKVGMVVEGYTTAKSAHQLARKYGVDTPIGETVYQVLYEGLPALEGLQKLLARAPRSEKE